MVLAQYGLQAVDALAEGRAFLRPFGLASLGAGPVVVFLLGLRHLGAGAAGARRNLISESSPCSVPKTGREGNCSSSPWQGLKTGMGDGLNKGIRYPPASS
jgi:hypothetical protein